MLFGHTHEMLTKLMQTAEGDPEFACYSLCVWPTVVML